MQVRLMYAFAVILFVTGGLGNRTPVPDLIGSRVVAAHPPTLATPAQEKAVADEIIAFRKLLADTIVAKNAAKLRELYTQTFNHTHTSGKMDGRDARIVSALAGEPVIETAETTDLVIRIPNDWTGIATGNSPIRAMSDGKVYTVHWTAVYVRTEKSWQLAASHATRGQEIKP